jgi:hypothetical protein
MAIIETTVVVTTWICDICGHGATHTSGTNAPLTAEHFVDKAGYRQIGPLVVCELCRILPDVAVQERALEKAASL